MDLRKVKKLIELFEASELVEMEISEGDNTIRMNRGGVGLGPVHSKVMSTVQKHPESPDREEAEASTQDESVVEDGDTIDSPMVGSFYDAPSPDAPPFVTVGSVVSPGDVLCIIEAMKTFNHVESEVSGTIRAVYKSSGDPVEYGEPLFLLDPH